MNQHFHFFAMLHSSSTLPHLNLSTQRPRGLSHKEDEASYPKENQRLQVILYPLSGYVYPVT